MTNTKPTGPKYTGPNRTDIKLKCMKCGKPRLRGTMYCKACNTSAANGK